MDSGDRFQRPTFLLEELALFLSLPPILEIDKDGKHEAAQKKALEQRACEGHQGHCSLVQFKTSDLS